MNFIYGIHLRCWNYLTDLITHNKNRNCSGGLAQKNGVRAKLARVFLVPAHRCFPSVSFASVLCDQINEVAPAYQVDDKDEVHQVDPVHPVDHKDEFTIPKAD